MPLVVKSELKEMRELLLKRLETQRGYLATVDHAVGQIGMRMDIDACDMRLFLGTERRATLRVIGELLLLFAEDRE